MIQKCSWRLHQAVNAFVLRFDLEYEHTIPVSSAAKGGAMQAGGREVKGLMEALQVTAPRASSTACLVSGGGQPYPSAAAMACLTAADASQCIWAAAVLGGSSVFEPEINGLVQVSCFHGAMPIVQ